MNDDASLSAQNVANSPPGNGVASDRAGSGDQTMATNAGPSGTTQCVAGALMEFSKMYWIGKMALLRLGTQS